jgi:transmembrane sensor
MPIRHTLAGFALVAVLAMLLWLPGALRFWASDYHTGWGERREIALDDGSLIALNTHAALSVEFSPAQRVIKLLEGEAYFQVSHDPDRPFVVVTSHGVAEVTGTAFNVYEQFERMTVTVSEGRVRVYPEGGENRAVELTAGLEVSGDGREVGPVLRVDVEQKLAWREGLLVFSMQPLAAVVDELNRYFPGRIVIADPRIRERVVSGAFDLTRPQDIMTAIEQTLGLDSLNLPGSLILLYQPIL